MKSKALTQQHLAALQQALVVHQAGNIEEALQTYRRLYKQYPRNPDVLRLLGTAKYQLGQAEEGADHLRQSLKEQPQQPGTWNNLGNALKQLGRLEEAVDAYDQALALKTDYADAYNNKGVVLRDLLRLKESLTCYDKAISIRPNYFDAHNNRGAVLKAMRRYEEAISSYDRALALKPDYFEAHNNKAIALLLLGRPQESLLSANIALSYCPNHAEVINTRGNALKAIGQREEALACYEQAIALNFSCHEAHANRGNILKELGRLSEALVSLDSALSIQPDYADGWNIRGAYFHELNQLDIALECYEQAVAIDPDLAEAHWNKALLLILLGRYSEGWVLFEWRWLRNAARTFGKFRGLPWLGQESIVGKTLLIYPEQGLGDYLQFCRYAPLVEALGAKVILEAPSALLSVLGTLPGNITVIATGDPLPPYDVLCPVMSLPLAFRTTVETIPATVPYLFADPAKTAEWQDRLGERSKPRIGLVWSGNPTHKNDHNRSLSLSQLAPVLDLPFEFHCLQKDIREEDEAILQQYPQVHIHAEALRDFSETAALVESMDLVISVDTSVAHLAGALGKPLWVLLPYMPDYRWMLDRSDSPWYPSARLFRQPEIGDWNTVVRELGASLLQRFK